MQALVQGFTSLVAALACSAFAHFGLTLKTPCPQTDGVVHRIPVSAPAAHGRGDSGRAPLAKGIRRA